MEIHPVIASILQAPVVQQQQEAEKARRLRKGERFRSVIARLDHEAVHPVEDIEKTEPIHQGREEEIRRLTPHSRQTIAEQTASTDEDDHPHIDVTA